jgi:hypothetical protein
MMQHNMIFNSHVAEDPIYREPHPRSRRIVRIFPASSDRGD